MKDRNFHDIHLKSMTHLDDYSVEHPLFKEPLKGHLFLKQKLPIKGAEIGMHRLEAYESMPYYHKHNKHEETYIFYSGVGEFKIDDRVIPIKEGSIIHVLPQGIRTWRNTGKEPLFWICVQSDTEHEMLGDTKDGTAFQKEVVWA